MHTLYDSECFAVVHTALMDREASSVDWSEAVREGPSLAGESHLGESGVHGFEIVDKRSNKEVYLHGEWADTFRRQINAWRLDTPTQEEVEETLGGYAELAQTSLLIH